MSSKESENVSHRRRSTRIAARTSKTVDEARQAQEATPLETSEKRVTTQYAPSISKQPISVQQTDKLLEAGCEPNEEILEKQVTSTQKEKPTAERQAEKPPENARSGANATESTSTDGESATTPKRMTVGAAAVKLKKLTEILEKETTLIRDVIRTTFQSRLKPPAAEQPPAGSGTDPTPPNPLATAEQRLKAAQEKVQRGIRELQHISNTVLLNPEEIYAIHLLEIRLNQLQILQRIYLVELEFLQSAELPKAKPAGLLEQLFIPTIVRQPPSQVLFKDKEVDDSILIELLHGACTQLEPSTVFVDLISEIDSPSSGASQATANIRRSRSGRRPRTQHHTTADAVATGERTEVEGRPIVMYETADWTSKLPTKYSLLRLSNIRVCGSTRMEVVRLRVTVYVTLSMATRPLPADSGDNSENTAPATDQRWVEELSSSMLSEPVVVITNESQWCEAAGKLLSMTVGSAPGEQAMLWTAFANKLQELFAHATRQPIGATIRGLSLMELDYFHRRFFRRQVRITTRDVDRFWTWFAPVLQALRFKKRIAEFWKMGYLCSFMSKEECVQFLDMAVPAEHNTNTNESTPCGPQTVAPPYGQFLLRFSETLAGQFAIVLKTQEGKPEHVLVPQEATSFNRTLPDYLRIQQPLRKLIRFGPKMCYAIDKDQALGKFYSKKPKKAPKVQGYIFL